MPRRFPALPLLPPLLTAAVVAAGLTGMTRPATPPSSPVPVALPSSVPTRPKAPSPLAVTSVADGRLDVFAQAQDGRLLYGLWTRNGGWRPTANLGGRTASGPAATTTTDGELMVFVRGGDGALWTRSFWRGRWTSWAGLAGSLVGEPAVVSTAGGRVDVFVRGTNNALFQKTRNRGRWGPWRTLDGTLTSSPAAASTGGSTLVAIVRGPDNAAWSRTFDGRVWGTWRSLGGQLSANPSAAGQATGQLDVYVRGTNAAIYHRSLLYGRWGPWESLGGFLGGGPAAASYGPRQTTVLALGDNGVVYQKEYLRTWSAWRTVPMRDVSRDYSEVLSPGVRFRAIFDPAGPWAVQVVDIDLSSGATLDTALADDSLPGLETTSSMARRHGAVAAVNGDYALSSGRPVHAYAEDGRLLQTTQMLGRNFAVRADKAGAYLGFPTFEMTADLGSAKPGIPRVNSGAPATDQVAMFTPAGGSLEQPPGNACSARLRSSARPTLDSMGRVVEQHSVTTAFCGSEALLAAPEDAVLTTPLGGSHEPALRNLAPGANVTTTWSLGWPGILDAIGGNPTLVENGVIPAGNVDGSTAYFGRNPRTGVGIAPGRIMLVTVDGRSARSRGMSLREFAELMVRLGARDALNLDGGGSTTMTVDGVVTNRPSDGYQRPVANALLVLPGADRGENGAPGPATRSAAEVWRSISRDAASTGGYASTLRRQGQQLSGPMRQAADEYDR